MPCSTEEECRRCIITGNCAAAGVTRSEAFWELFQAKLGKADDLAALTFAASHADPHYKQAMEEFVFGLFDEARKPQGNGKDGSP